MGQGVEEYIAGFEPAVQKYLEKIRLIIRETAPDCKEKIAWGAPAYYQNGYRMQFAACKNHLGFYTSPGTLKAFEGELSSYKTNKKNTVQFPYNRELPGDLIRRMVLYRMAEGEKEA
jgi:uncharacterized protein YdhG (YjbR/CyaY superfamily)